MATTNLIERTLGNITLSTGNGVPDHTAAQGSIYIDQDTSDDYINTTGLAVWEKLHTGASGELYRSATSRLSPSTVGYTELSTNFILRGSEGVSLVPGADNQSFIRSQLVAPSAGVSGVWEYTFSNIEVGDAMSFDPALQGPVIYTFTSTDPAVYVDEMVTAINANGAVTAVATPSNVGDKLRLTQVATDGSFFIFGDSISNLSGGRLLIDSGYDGEYGILITTTFSYVATESSQTIGILINGAAPISGDTQRTSVSSTRNSGSATISTTANLVAGDTISSGVQAGSAGDVDITYQSLIIWKKVN